MKKILVALDSHSLNTEAIEFSCYLARQLRTRLTGVFIKRIAPGPVTTVARGSYLSEHEDITIVAANTRQVQFCEACICRDTDYDLHPEGAISASNLIRESRFADLLILDPGITLMGSFEAAPTAAVKYIMQKAECPVIIAPQNFESAEEIIFTCDGSSSSVHAIKQFSYLFSCFAGKPVTVLQVNNHYDNYRLREWLDTHYKDVSFIEMEGDRISRIISYLLVRNNAFVVMGAYNKNFVSNLVAPGTIEHLAGTLTRPVFIARR